MTEEQFLEQVSPLSEHNDFYFSKADPGLGQYSFCRAYINFVHHEDVFIFKDKFDSYVFLDSKGNEYPAIVEFAPSQKIPRRRIGPNGLPLTAKKRDNKSGTIEQDPDYLNFLEELEKSKTAANLPSADVYLEEIEAKEKELRANHGVVKLTTPLIEYLKQKKAEKLKRVEERREERRKEYEKKEQKRIEKEMKRKIKEKEKKLQLEKKKEEERKKRKEDEERRKQEKFKQEDSKYKSSEKSEKSKDFDSKKKENDNIKSDKSSSKSSKKNEDVFVVKILENDKNKERKSESETVRPSNSDVKEDKEKETKEKDVKERDRGSKDKESRESKSRMRNKDRPAREIYRPGARRGSDDTKTSPSQKNEPSNESSTKESSKSSSRQKRYDAYGSSGSSSRKSYDSYGSSSYGGGSSYRSTRVFTRSKQSDQ